MKVLSEICTRCGLEVRAVVGGGRWLHQVPPADGHNVRLGLGPSIHPVESQRLRDAWLREHGELTDVEEAAHVEPIPDPEIKAWPIDAKTRIFAAAPPDGIPAVIEMPGGARTIYNLAIKHGWDPEATYARGPYLHSTRWTSTGICSTVLLRGAGGIDRFVASWRMTGGSWKFDYAWTWHTSAASLRQIKTDDLKVLIKGEQHG